MPKETIRSKTQNVSCFNLSPKSKGITMSSPVLERVEQSATISTSSGAVSSINHDIHSQYEALQFEVDILKHQNAKLTENICSRKNSMSSPFSSENESIGDIDKVNEPSKGLSLHAVESFFLGLFTAFLLFGLLYYIGLFNSGSGAKKIVVKQVKNNEYLTSLVEGLNSQTIPQINGNKNSNFQYLTQMKGSNELSPSSLKSILNNCPLQYNKFDSGKSNQIKIYQDQNSDSVNSKKDQE